MNESVIDTVIANNQNFKQELFESLPKDHAYDIWFYAHLGNYGNVCAEFVDKVPCSPTSEKFKFGIVFKHIFRFGGIVVDEPIFRVDFDSEENKWSDLVSALKLNAKAILGLEAPKPIG